MTRESGNSHPWHPCDPWFNSGQRCWCWCIEGGFHRKVTTGKLLTGKCRWIAFRFFRSSMFLSFLPSCDSGVGSASGGVGARVLSDASQETTQAGKLRQENRQGNLIFLPSIFLPASSPGLSPNEDTTASRNGWTPRYFRLNCVRIVRAGRFIAL